MSDKPLILVVGDTSESLALLLPILTQTGYQARAAGSGELALAAVAAKAPDLILLDVGMQGMDGPEVCRRLKAREETRHIPVILISAFADVEERVKGLRLGAADYITKPFQTEELLTRVETHLCLGRTAEDQKRDEGAVEARRRELQILYDFASGLAAAHSGNDMCELIARGLKAITGAASATFSVYDPVEKHIRVQHAEVEPGLMSDLVRVLGGKKLTEAAFPLSDDLRRELLRNPIGYSSSLSEVTFGVVPGFIGTVVQKVQGIDRFLGIAYKLEGELFGTSLVALRANTPDPPAALLNSFAEMVAVSLRRVRAENALRQSQGRLMGIVDSAMDGIVTIDDTERIQVFNAAAEAMFGCPAAEAIGQPVHRFIPERFRAARPEHVQPFDQMGESRPSAPSLQHIGGRRASGEEFPIEASMSRTAVDGRELLTIILRDITEQVRSEEARAQLEAQLRLTQRMESLGTLGGGIAHEFNNILGAIIGNAELARQDVGSEHPAMESLDEILKASQRAKDLAHRILAFGRREQAPESVIPLRPVVEDALAFLRATIPAAVEIAMTCDADAPTVWAERTQIHQVLINLCTNAWQAMAGHAGRIDVRLDGVTLDAEATRVDAAMWPGRFARLSVTDTGAGMTPATLEHVFEPFFTTKPVGQGTGLGLSVVHGIVKVHGGAITVTSQPGQGTTFCLYFPAAESPGRSDAPEDAVWEPLPASRGQHVLYLDDEEPLVFMVKCMLERLKYRVSGYTRADEALAAVRDAAGQFDLVVTDLNMPGMSGLDVARELARLRPDLPVVLVSGYITEELRAAALHAGVRQLIYKPNTVEELCAAVHRLARPPKRP